MIVRISTEGQYEIPDEDSDKLNDLDNEVVAAVDSGDEDRFHEVFEEMLNLVRTDGHKLGEDELVLRLVAAHGGSISAEHGIGVAKRAWLGLTRSEEEIAAMRAIKAALDPGGIMNPGAVV